MGGGYSTPVKNRPVGKSTLSTGKTRGNERERREKSKEGEKEKKGGKEREKVGRKEKSKAPGKERKREDRHVYLEGI